MACGNCTLGLIMGQSIVCKGECKQDFCYMCADLKPQQCEMLNGTLGSSWKCKTCRKNNSQLTNSSDLNGILLAMKNSMEEDRQERRTQISEINEKLHSISGLTTKVEKIETEIATHDDRLSKLETKIETKIEKSKPGEIDVRQTNAIIRELREIESREKNLIFSNIPEPVSQLPENRKQEDLEKTLNILKALEITDIMPIKVIRVGKKGNYPRKLLVITHSTSNCEKILEKAETTRLDNNVFISRDRTFNQREEARLYKEEKDKSEQPKDPSISNRGRSRGRSVRGRGRGRGVSRDPGRPEQPNDELRNIGSVRGRGSRRGRGNLSRKRKNSGHDDYSEKRQRSLDPSVTPANLIRDNRRPEEENKRSVDPLPSAVVTLKSQGQEPPTKRPDLGSLAHQPLAVVPLKPQGQELSHKMPTAVDVRTKKNPTQGEHVDTGTSTSFIAPDFSLTSPIHSADCSQFESTITPEDF